MKPVPFFVQCVLTVSLARVWRLYMLRSGICSATLVTHFKQKTLQRLMQLSSSYTFSPRFKLVML